MTEPVPLPEWSKMDDLGGLVPSEIRVGIRAYGDARAAAERERCAKVCEDEAFVDQWKGLSEAVRRIRNMEQTT